VGKNSVSTSSWNQPDGSPTGRRRERTWLPAPQGDHLGAGTNEDVTFIQGVNETKGVRRRPASRHLHRLVHHELPGAAGQVLDDGLGIEQGTMLTIHAYTQDQNLQDGPSQGPAPGPGRRAEHHPDHHRGGEVDRQDPAAARRKLDGYSIRVPTPVGSLTDLTVRVGRDTTAEEINGLYQKAASGPLAGILRYTEDPLVSADIVTDPASCIFDSLLTRWWTAGTSRCSAGTTTSGLLQPAGRHHPDDRLTPPGGWWRGHGTNPGGGVSLALGSIVAGNNWPGGATGRHPGYRQQPPCQPAHGPTPDPPRRRPRCIGRDDGG